MVVCVFRCRGKYIVVTVENGGLRCDLVRINGGKDLPGHDRRKVVAQRLVNADLDLLAFLEFALKEMGAEDLIYNIVSHKLLLSECGPALYLR